MGSRPLLLALAAVLCISQRVTAQVNTATVNGIVTDESKAVLPGVTILAADLETGREYEAMTDERGAYQFVSLPPGTYKLRATLTGFATAEVPRVEILVGQNATILLALKLANLQESVTVSTQAPLVDVTSSQVAGNVDRRQMEDLPLQGRNWMELSMLIKGITANNVTNTPGVSKDDAFQLNLDGQQITQKIAGSGLGQPKFSREAIAEFQIVTNLFDVTQGRSTGVQVQAISRSGTNNLSGALYGFFRSDKFNAPDPVAARVLPYSNQQAGGAIGGPVIKDKLHFFFSYEHEREPNTVFTKPAFLGGPSASFPFTVNQDIELGRMDWQISTRNSLNVRLSRWNWKNPFSLAGDAFPSQAGIVTQYSRDVVGTWSQALSNNRFAELRIAYAGFEGGNQPIPAVFGQRPAATVPKWFPRWCHVHADVLHA